MLTVRLAVLALVSASFLVLGGSGSLTPIAQATLPPGAGCPQAAGNGNTPYEVTATLPPDGVINAHAVCVALTGTGGQNRTGVLIENPAGCQAPHVAPAVDAGVDRVWAQWGTDAVPIDCVAPGNRVIIKFFSDDFPKTVASVTWHLATGATLAGTGTVRAGAVGGIAERPDVGALQARESGSSAGRNAALAGGAAAVVFVLAGGVLYARRRWLG